MTKDELIEELQAMLIGTMDLADSIQQAAGQRREQEVKAPSHTGRKAMKPYDRKRRKGCRTIAVQRARHARKQGRSHATVLLIFVWGAPVRPVPDAIRCLPSG